jgi:beta-glucosidase/6-phospho-beta-glucosidase/beta-galactosidase
VTSVETDPLLFGVATAGFQIEGGYNSVGAPANNWFGWEHVGRIEPSGNAVGFWERPEEMLDRAAALGCDSFRMSVEWARVVPEPGQVDRAALDRYVSIVSGCLVRGLQPMVTLHHFTHPEWLGEEFWLRPDAPTQFRGWAELVVEALAPMVRLWVTINEINVLSIGTWLLGMFPPGRFGALRDVAIAEDNLLAAHVAAYEVIHRLRPDAVVTTNNSCMSIYERDRMLTDVLLAPSMGVERADVGEWLAERRRLHDASLPPDRPTEKLLRKFSASQSAYGARPRRRTSANVAPAPSDTPDRALRAVYDSPHERTLDAIGIDYYEPMAARHFRLPGHRTAGGRNRMPTRELWDEVPDPVGLTSWLLTQRDLTPGLPIWVVENGMCNRVRQARSYPREDGWDRPRYLRENIAAVMAAVDQGVPVQGYWHWSLVDNYEWGSYEPRFGLYGIDRHSGEHGMRWLETDSLGNDAAGAYRQIIAGLRADDRTALG